MSFLQLFKQSALFTFILCLCLNIVAIFAQGDKLSITPTNILLQVLMIVMFALIISSFVKFVLWILRML